MQVNAIYLSLLLIGILGMNGCRSRQKPEASADSTQHVAQTALAKESGLVVSERLEALFGSGDALIRGINLGDPLEVVKEKEKAELFETTNQYVGYVIEYPNLESVDLLYYYDNHKQISKIVVDLYLNDQQSVSHTINELNAYFNRRFGMVSHRNRVATWKTSDGVQVVLTEVSKGKDFGLKLIIKPAAAPVVTAKAN